MTDVGAPFGAKMARQVGCVARVVIALSVAVGVMGCDGTSPQHAEFTDADGCDWRVDYTVHIFGADVVRFDKVAPRLDRDGKHLCGAP